MIIIFFNLKLTLFTLSKDTEAFITTFLQLLVEGGKKKEKTQMTTKTPRNTQKGKNRTAKKSLSTLKALNALFYYGVDGDRLSLQSSLVPRVFPVKLSSFLLSIAFSCTGTALLDMGLGFCGLLCCLFCFCFVVCVVLFCFMCVLFFTSMRIPFPVSTSIIPS